MSSEATVLKNSVWNGGRVPLGVSFGKMMMWFFLLSDAFTFSTLLVCYGYFRITATPGWVSPEHVFEGIPWIEGVKAPLVFVGMMTFILIFSSVTMVLAVEAGHRMDQKAVKKFLILTIIGGALFLASQALEWTGLIFQEGMTIHYNPFLAVMANGNPLHLHATVLFGQLFFIITGFHGFHVFSGVVINSIMYRKTSKGDFQRRGHYEMIEKVGLYWHFVDLVWVFVFTLFYLI